METLKSDISFLKEVLEKVAGNNAPAQVDGCQMLRDQIDHMERRLEAVALDLAAI